MEIARRVFLGIGLAGTAGWLARLRAVDRDSNITLPGTVRIAQFDAAGRPLGIKELPAIRKSDAEWKKMLALDQYTVTRRNDTEMAFAGEYWNFHGDGIYRCVCCGTALFDSETKFSSGYRLAKLHITNHQLQKKISRSAPTEAGAWPAQQ